MGMCSKCGIEMKEGARYCKTCGSGMPGKGGDLISEKKARVTAAEKPGGRPILIAAGAVIVILLIVIVAGAFRGGRGSKAMVPSVSAVAVAAPAMAQASNGMVRIALAELADGKAHFYAYQAGSDMIRFFLIRKEGGSIGVALDACNSCYRAKRGYRQQGQKVICNNCNMVFDPKDVGVVTGGCNPIPVPFSQEGGSVVVKAVDLEKGRQYF